MSRPFYDDVTPNPFTAPTNLVAPAPQPAGFAAVITGTTTGGIVLSDPATQNPTTLATGGLVTNNTTHYNGDAVYGKAPTAWTFSNFGTIKATNAASAGIDLRAGGTVSNAAGGSIAGVLGGVGIFGAAGSVANLGTIRATGATGIGVYLAKGGAVVNGATNATTALISGLHIGVSIFGSAAARLNNYGTIQGTAASSYGIYLKSGARISNAASGLISGLLAGISTVGTAVSTIGNSGTIRGVAAGSAGVELNAAATVTNSGVIAGALVGVFVGAGGDTVINSGTIEATAVNGDGVYLKTAARVSNAANGSIIGIHDGVVMFGTAASTVTNLGTIAAGGGGADSLLGVYMQGPGSVINGATNSTAAVIYGPAVGLYMRQASGVGAVTNFGTIRGSNGSLGVGIRVAHDGSVLNGATNATAALISGGNVGVAIQGAAGTIGNFGTIAGVGTFSFAYGIYMNAGTVINGAPNVTSALISGASSGITMFGTAASVVTNFGTIAGGGFGNLGVQDAPKGIFMRGWGSVINGAAATPTALIVGTNYGLVMASTFANTVSNFGTIAATATLNTSARLYPAGLTMSLGTVINGTAGAAAALISGANDGIRILGTAASTVSNFGTIRGASTLGDGIYIIGGGYVGNQPGGLIDGLNDGVVIAGVITSTVSNLGTIAAGNGADLQFVPYGIYMKKPGTVINGAPGQGAALIEGAYAGIEMKQSSGNGTVDNFGTVSGGSGTIGTGIFLTGNGSIVNGAPSTPLALISGVDVGVELDGSAASASNFGTIVATALENPGAHLYPIGLYLRGGSVTNGATDATAALITGENEGIKIGGTIASRVSNFGTIHGSSTLGDGIFISGGGYVGNHTSGLITAVNDGVVIAGTITSTVTNLGTILAGNGTNLQFYPYGVYIKEAGTLFNGGPSDLSAMIRGAYAGVEIKHASGNVDNFGTITGGTGTIGIGIYLGGAGSVVNGALGAGAALITGIADGVKINGVIPSTVKNFGTIAGLGTFSSGADLTIGTVSNYGLIAAGPRGSGVSVDGGVVFNFKTGTIEAAQNGYGVSVYGYNNGTVVNEGTIIAPGSSGMAVAARGGTFINSGLVVGHVAGIVLAPGTSAGGNGMVTVSGTVVGATGITAASTAGSTQTLTVAGTVVGTSGTAVSLTPGGGDRLILDLGAAFQGAVEGGGGASVLEVAGLAAAAALSDLAAGDNAYVDLGGVANFTSLQIDAGAAADASGVLSFDTLVNQGLVTVAAGDALALGVVAGAANTGVIALHPGGLVRFAGSVAAQAIDFGPPGGTAAIDQPGAFAATLAGFAVGDTIDLEQGTATGAHYAGGVLSLSYNGNPVSLAVTTPYAAPVFVLGADGQGGTDITVQPESVPRDFNGDGTSDILWRSSDGNVSIWEMSGLSIGASAIVGFADPTAWTIRGTGDFNGDGRSDILWQDSGGNVDIWEMNGFSVVASGLAGFSDPASWSIVATGDFDGNGTSDILWQETGGNVAIWEMNGAAVASSAIVGFTDPTAWHIRGTGDFNGDGKADILWQGNSGNVAIWEMKGFSVAASAVVGFADPASWHIEGTGDFNGDGKSDILWQDTSGDVVIWEMNGFSVAASAAVGFADPASWRIAGIGDFNGDGKSDILWHSSGGNVDVWEMNGLSIAASGLVGFADPASWSIAPPDNTGDTAATVAAATTLMPTSPVTCPVLAAGHGLP